MSGTVHATAVVDAAAELDCGVSVGPYAVIGPAVRIGSGTMVAAHAVIEGATSVGANCRIGVGAVLGGPPQDRKYRGEATRLEIGADTLIREYTTINRGSTARGLTSVGRGCFLMTYVHIAHDCVIEDEVTLANAVQMAGHVHIEAHATVGGSTPIHQFVRIGTHAFVGGGSRVPQDVPPYARAAGNPLRLFGINTLGLTRAGVSPETRHALQHAYRLLFNSDLPRRAAIERLEREGPMRPEVERLVAFVRCSERGVLV